MDEKSGSHTRAALQAQLVTFLWSSSWVQIKIGLVDIPALPFAGLRYSLAFFCLLPFAVRSGQLGALRHLPRAAWVRLVLLGLLFYAVTQGAQFVSLAYLPALTTSLILSFTTILVALLGRMTATMRWLTLLAAAPGALLGGWLGEHVGLRSALGFAGGVSVLLVVVAWRLPLIRELKALPQPEQESDWLGVEASVRPAE